MRYFFASTLLLLVLGVPSSMGTPAALPAPVAPVLDAPALSRAVATKYKLDLRAASDYVHNIFKYARVYKQDPVLMVSVAGVESSFQPTAKSHKGAVGLMQVMPKVHTTMLRKAGLDLLHPEDNIHAGIRVYRDAAKRSETVVEALQRYNGNLKDKNARYARKVLAVQNKLHQLALN